jgi:hypothetical protein
MYCKAPLRKLRMMSARLAPSHPTAAVAGNADVLWLTAQRLEGLSKLSTSQLVRTPLSFTTSSD